MKTRLLVIIGIIMLGTVLALVVIDGWQGYSIPKPLLCGGDFIQQGNECVLDPELIEPNTVIIYDVVDNSGTRLSIAPYTMVMNLTGDDTVTFVNNGATTVNVFVHDGVINVNVFDNSEGIWKVFNDVKPSSQRTLIINDTGYYQFIIQNSLHGATGEIVALSEDTNSLPVDTRAKMAQALISNNFRINPELIGVGSGGAPGTGVIITINQEELELREDAKSYYYEKYRKIIPFDVPITIEFSEPMRLLTG